MTLHDVAPTSWNYSAVRSTRPAVRHQNSCYRKRPAFVAAALPLANGNNKSSDCTADALMDCHVSPPRSGRSVVGAAKDRQLVVRLPAGLRARLERVRDALSKRAGGVDLVTSHVVREVIERGLDSIERDLWRK
jgi:predicted DNA-binding protein